MKRFTGTRAAVRQENSTLALSGDWVIGHLRQVSTQLERIDAAAVDLVDASAVSRWDTAGVWELLQLERRGGESLRIEGLDGAAGSLLELAREHGDAGQELRARAALPPRLERVGQGAWETLQGSFGMLDFFGRIMLACLRLVRAPGRFRPREFIQAIYRSGFQALPIVGLLAFLIGIVIAYQGVMLLQIYGAQIFVVDLVGLSITRELGPLITAIIVAGRTGSAFTAQIGTMKVSEEIDALRTMGLPPMEVLVVPRFLALVLALPLLTLFAIGLGVFGGMLLAKLAAEISATAFVDRLWESLDFRTLFLGLVKTPVFAAIIATVGCYQGFQVSGGAASVGQRTTTCVVQAIFLVIVADAAFSILFSLMDI